MPELMEIMKSSRTIDLGYLWYHAPSMRVNLFYYSLLNIVHGNGILYGSDE